LFLFFKKREGISLLSGKAVILFCSKIWPNFFEKRAKNGKKGMTTDNKNHPLGAALNLETKGRNVNARGGHHLKHGGAPLQGRYVPWWLGRTLTLYVRLSCLLLVL